MKPKRSHRPERTCLGCRQRDAQERMMRFTAPGEDLIADWAGRRPGRGGYLHWREKCITEFVRGKTRECRSLRRKLGFDQRFRLVESIRAWLDRKAALT